MGYDVKKIELECAYKKVREYEYALIYMISERFFCRTDDLPELDWEECLEARFFSGDRELHIFEGEDGMAALEISDTDTVDTVVKKYRLNSAFRKLGSVLCVMEYLSYDEDGQIAVELTRLKGIE